MAEGTLVVRPIDVPPEATLDAPELEELDFRPLGACEIGPPGITPVPTRVYCARYGDAYGFVDPLDADVRLRVVSVLHSGRLVETRVVAAPTRRRTTRIDRVLDGLERARLHTRYPTRAAVGVHRELLDVDDLQTLWVAHRGFVRRVQGIDDEVEDHGSLDLFAAAMQRAWLVRTRVDHAELKVALTATQVARVALLALPAMFALQRGLAWWMAAIVAGVPALGALAVQRAMRRRVLRKWAVFVPVAIALLGWAVLDAVVLVAVLAFDLGVLWLAEAVLPQLAVRAVGLVRGEARSPAPAPLTGA